MLSKFICEKSQVVMSNIYFEERGTKKPSQKEG